MAAAVCHFALLPEQKLLSSVADTDVLLQRAWDAFGRLTRPLLQQRLKGETCIEIVRFLLS